jgi:hypothetical protein
MAILVLLAQVGNLNVNPRFVSDLLVILDQYFVFSLFKGLAV